MKNKSGITPCRVQGRENVPFSCKRYECDVNCGVPRVPKCQQARCQDFQGVSSLPYALMLLSIVDHRIRPLIGPLLRIASNEEDHMTGHDRRPAGGTLGYPLILLVFTRSVKQKIYQVLYTPGSRESTQLPDVPS